MTPIVIIAGLSQLALAAGSLAIPRILNWRSETVKLSPLIRSVFWTYAGYIWGTNVCFGLLSTFAPTWLLDGSPLARAVSGFISMYWGARVVIQFAFFGKHAPPGNFFKLAEVALVILFLFLTGLYGAITLGKT